MHMIALVLLLGTSLNVANAHPQNLADVEAALLAQIQHPVIEADYSNLNK